MNHATVEKKIEILENALAACAGAYYNINLTRNCVPGTMYQILDGVRHSINQAIGLPENAPFTEVVNYWGSKLSAEEQPGYFSFFAVDHLLQEHAQGRNHVFHRYWTKTALFEPMLAEQHVEMYTDDETGDVLAVSYVLDLTQEYRERQYKEKLEKKQRSLENSLKELNEEKQLQEDVNTKLEDQIHIISGLANAYFAVYWVNLRNNTCRAVKNIDFFEKAAASCRTTDEVVNAFVTRCVHPEDQEKTRCFADWRTLPERFETHDTIVREFHGVLTPWEWCRASWIVASRGPDGKAKEALFAVEDITESFLKRQESERELKEARDAANAANKAKTTFLFNMSHDIRTPMNAIVGYTTLLEKNKADPKKCADYVAKIQASSDFLLSLINNVLEMARIESGKAVLDIVPVSRGKITSAVVTVYEEEMRKKRIQFTSSVEIRADYIYCDELKIKEILLNLLSNAYKYTPEGGRVEMCTKELPCGRVGYTRLQTTVSDNGIGMAKEYLPTLFDEFSRERTSAGNRIEGTGLGMAIVKGLVELMGGTIEVQSELGKGTTFTVTMEHRIAQKSEIQTDETAEVETKQLIGKRILLAEDNDLNAEIAMEILKDYGILVERAEDGVACIDMLQKADAGYYDLILMDVQMPNLDGYQAARRIRTMEDPEKKEIPIIAMTANAFEEDRQNAIAAGMNEHLAKPIDIVALKKKLAMVFG